MKKAKPIKSQATPLKTFVMAILVPDPDDPSGSILLNVKASGSNVEELLASATEQALLNLIRRYGRLLIRDTVYLNALRNDLEVVGCIQTKS